MEFLEVMIDTDSTTFIFPKEKIVSYIRESCDSSNLYITVKEDVINIIKLRQCIKKVDRARVTTKFCQNDNIFYETECFSTTNIEIHTNFAIPEFDIGVQPNKADFSLNFEKGFLSRISMEINGDIIYG